MDLKKWSGSKVGGGASGPSSAKKNLSNAMAKARQYVTDFDKDGKKATAILELLNKAVANMSKPGEVFTPDDKEEAESIIQHKMAPASRAILEGQLNYKK